MAQIHEHMPNPITAGFIKNEKGQLIDSRSGKTASVFTLQGTNPDGSPVLMKFAGNEIGFKSMHLIKRADATRHVIYTDGTQDQLTLNERN